MKAVLKLTSLIFLAFILWGSYLAYAVHILNPQMTAEWGYVDEDTTELWLHVSLGSKLPILANIKSATLELAGVEFGRVDNVKFGFMSDAIDIPIVIDNKKAVEALKAHIKNNENSEIKITIEASLFGISLKKELTQNVETDILSALNIQTESENAVILQTPAVERVDSRWGEVDEDITIYSDILVYNPNSFPLPVRGLEYSIDIDEYNVAQGELLEGVTIPAKGRETVKVKTILNTELLPKVWAQHIKQGERSTIGVKLYIKTTVLKKDIRIKLLDYEETIETNILKEISLMS
ncbi:hypothetical protein PAP_07865 [Palaeococcus pacificus DY20341]|uniref:Water stress and hypersensitive response domain-containing protein n=1 Tax=Palaeococcus pacificus DY20341 TaxID=1343739 RepID=A0A075LVC6_9EURY|nr:LEA type 2 family protein [Palaeococcus pacificus]AIF69962.1 hypothetical protein PAP_07865 [Palaeococcus pacificus DY20341]